MVIRLGSATATGGQRAATSFWMLQVPLYVYLLTCLPTPCNQVLLQKLTGSQLVKKLPAFYGIRRIIIAFTSAHHLSLS